MRASILDLEKVMVVVTKQITTVIVNGGLSLTSLEIFGNKFYDLNYKKITQTEESSQLLDENVLSPSLSRSSVRRSNLTLSTS